MPWRHVAIVSIVWAVLLGGGRASARAAEAGDEFFEKQVRPILVSRCFECHSAQAKAPKGGLRLDARDLVLKGGDTGPAAVPGQPDKSLLVDAIRYGDVYQMPPKSKLPAEEVAILTKWVELGLPWPAQPAAEAAPGAEGFDLAARRASHWCWQPIVAPPLPPVRRPDWTSQPLDRFILARLEQAGIDPAPAAEERALLRRLYFDLTGLPPTPEELEAVLGSLIAPPGRHERERGRGGEWDRRYAAVVDQLLASPRFGERWARHWLDLVRYAETRGHEFDYPVPNAFEYRDYVIRALNADVPYDQFVIEHVAGDLVEAPRLHPASGWNESIVGTGFWFLGEWVHSPVDIRKDECDRVDNMLDVFSKTFLGVTVACARCHDHKFDAISQRDYYALAGYLQSASYRLTRFETWDQERHIAGKLEALDERFRPQIAAAAAAAARARLDMLADRVAAEMEDLKSALGVPEWDLHEARVIADYSRPDAPWMTDGPTFGARPRVPGEVLLTGDAAAPLEVVVYGGARRDPTWGELAPAAGSEIDPGRLASWVRAGRTLKTPTFTLASGQVHYLIEGAGHVYAAVASHAMINGPLHAELVKDTGGNSDLPTRWITQDLSRYVGQRVHLEFSPKEGEDFRVLMVVEGPQRPSAPLNRPNRLLAELHAAFGGAPPEARREACRRLLAKTLDALVAGRIAGTAGDSDRAAIANWLVAQAAAEAGRASALADVTAAYVRQRDALLEQIPTQSRLCLAMWEGTPVDENLLVRGNSRVIGPVVPRGMLAALRALDSGVRSKESGVRNQESGERVQGPLARNDRLAMARSLVDPANPLVSRVIVNRVWHHLLGRGIVPSVDNLGVLGQPPTHPELLDFLAAEFMADGWSIKRLIRRIVLSSTYRQASINTSVDLAPGPSDSRPPPANSDASAVDPQNLLFHHQNLKRLEGEAIRDAMLAVSGRLDWQMYGPGVPVHLTPFMQGRGRPKESGPLDGAGRRTVYLAVRRNFLSPLMLAFDTPAPATTMGRRNVSNVPAQALILMNDPLVGDLAQQWARRLLAAGQPLNERLRQMYLAAFGREPTADELTAAAGFLEEQRQQAVSAQVPATEIEPRVWADLAHVLFNVKEFVFVP